MLFLLLPYITKEQNRVFSNTFAKRQIYQSRSSSWAVVIYFVVLPAQIQKRYRVVALQYIIVQASVYSLIQFHNMLRPSCNVSSGQNIYLNLGTFVLLYEWTILIYKMKIFPNPVFQIEVVHNILRYVFMYRICINLFFY